MREPGGSTVGSSRYRGFLLVLAGALALSGCAAFVTDEPPPSAERWQGTTTAGPAGIPLCGPMVVDLAVYRDPLYRPRLADGLAVPTAAPVGARRRAVAFVTTWSVEGAVSPADEVRLELSRERPIYFRAKPYAVWRGPIDGERMTLTESGSPCNRELVLTRAG